MNEFLVDPLLAGRAHLRNAVGSRTPRLYADRFGPETKKTGPALGAGPASCRELLLAAPQAEADASEGHENRSQGSSQEWESGVREGCPGADAAGFASCRLGTADVAR